MNVNKSSKIFYTIITNIELYVINYKVDII